jgi:hypothetical protein
LASAPRAYASEQQAACHPQQAGDEIGSDGSKLHNVEGLGNRQDPRVWVANEEMFR